LVFTPVSGQAQLTSRKLLNPKMKKPFKRKIKKVKNQVTERVSEKAVALNPLTPKLDEPTPLSDVPRITNQNITEHREDVLSGARKYIYPLQHSKHQIVTITIGIIITAIIGFSVYCSLALYHYYQSNTFLYRITQIVPFPIAKVGGRYVDYENYLFELRHYVHYYESQQQQTFSGSGSQQLLAFRKQALSDVINGAYIKQLAATNHISVSEGEVNARIAEVRAQNRLGSDNKVFADVLRNYWGWSVADFRRSLKDQMLADKVLAKLDTTDYARAQAALKKIKSGADFSDVAKKYSDDPSAKSNGGDYGISITRDNPNIPPDVVNALFSLKKPGQISNIIDAGSSLQIIKVNSVSGDAVSAQHITINLKPIATFIDPIKAKEPAHTYVHF